MSQTATAASIISRARKHADAETSTPTVDFVTDTDALEYLTAAYRRLVDVILKGGGIDLLLKSATLTAPTYALPADFYREASVDLPDGAAPSGFTPLKRFNFRERLRRCDTSFPSWRIVSGAIILDPSDATPATLKLWYIADVAVISSTATSVAVFNGWDDFLVYDIAAHIVLKEERDSSMLFGLRQAEAERIAGICKELCVVDTEVVADVQRLPEDFFDWTL